MARIRTIKPEFWTSEQVLNLPALARLTFIGLWTFCDDGGNHPASARTLKAEVFPADDLLVADVQQWIDALIEQGLVVAYDVDGRTFWHVTGWARHQRIDKPTFRHPKFVANAESDPNEFADNSTDTRGAFDESSKSTPGGIDEPSPPDWNGMERSR